MTARQVVGIRLARAVRAWPAGLTVAVAGSGERSADTIERVLFALARAGINPDDLA
ncbi:hypothetical protein GCM10009801_21390 [Streptomyces albiaxialis]|uniref:Transcriptional regulator n=1 Tax=Streptomyces albiaxialis TaxID=329523 RepID=A0ABN2VTT4_9ACTN